MTIRHMPGYWQLSFELGSLAADAAEQLCCERGALAVTFVAAGDTPVLEPLPGEFRLWADTRVQALFAGEDSADRLRADLSQALALPPAALRIEALEDRVWEREWLRDFHAMRFGSRLWISPQHEHVAADDAAIVRLDPGLAFGTGTHPSTALCLQWLDEHLRPGQRIIDYGCGSGILALAAVKLGAAHAYCFDIDPQALLATAQNAAANDISSRVSVVPSAVQLPAGVEVLVANILSGPLIELSRAFSSLVRADGHLLLAGLMDHEIGGVTQAYSAWFDMSCYGLRDGWAALVGRRQCRAAHGAVPEPGRP